MALHTIEPACAWANPHIAPAALSKLATLTLPAASAAPALPRPAAALRGVRVEAALVAAPMHDSQALSLRHLDVLFLDRAPQYHAGKLRTARG